MLFNVCVIQTFATYVLQLQEVGYFEAQNFIYPLNRQFLLGTVLG
jgi:hypothetical protein